MIKKFFKNKNQVKEKNPIVFFDIGCSQDFDNRWIKLAPRLNYFGCDPDETECKRLSAQPPADFAAAVYRPYAVSDKSEEQTLYVTNSPPCSSLLKPNNKFLDRFVFGELFHYQDKQKITTKAFDEFVDEVGCLPDVLKMDIQGAELSLLNGFPDICANALVIDLDVGFTRNYIGESVFWEVSEWMEKHGFLLMDLNVNRVRRKPLTGQFDPYLDYLQNDTLVAKSQPLWGSSIWVSDVVADVDRYSSESVSKMIEICNHLTFFDLAEELGRFC